MTDAAHSEPAQPSPALDLEGLPRSLRRAFAFLQELEVGELTVVFTDGRRFRFPGKRPGPSAVFLIRSMAFARRLTAGDVGLAEGYVAGEWDSPDLTAFLELLGANQEMVARFQAHPVLRLLQAARHWLNRNTKAGARRNIHAHYDLGNAFYSRWLDPSMTYSSGLGVADDLEAAQRRKYQAIAEAAGLRQGADVLEIGCGWGGFAEYAAGELGCRVTALTISAEQYRYAIERVARAGLSDRVSIKLQDYRDESGLYDAIVSIEMFEAVGEKYWPTYFDVLQRCLRDGAHAALQVITIREDIFPRYRREMDFIRRFIFPGGMLPTSSILRSLGEAASLRPVSDFAFGGDYAQTCRIWRERFDKAWRDVAPLGFDDRFRSLWTYYLSYCEAGFRSGTIDVRQVAFAKSGGVLR